MGRGKIRILKGGILLLIMAGVLMVCYPLWADHHYQKKVTYLTANLDTAVEDLSEKELKQMEAEAREFNEVLASLPNRWQMSQEQKDRYYQCLDVSGTGMMGEIAIPKIGVDIPIYHGDKSTVLQVGAGHMEGSSLPIGGKSTHAVIAAHTGMATAELFTRLDEMEAGDKFFIRVLQDELEYQVKVIRTVLPTETSYLAIQEGRDLVTLITCTPPGINSHRLLVTGERVNSQQKGLNGQVYMLQSQEIGDMMCIAGILLLIGIVICLLVKTIKKK